MELSKIAVYTIYIKRIDGSWSEIGRSEDMGAAQDVARKLFHSGIARENIRVVKELPDGRIQLTVTQLGTLKLLAMLGGDLTTGKLSGKNGHKREVRAPWGLTYIYSSTLTALKNRKLIDIQPIVNKNGEPDGENGLIVIMTEAGKSLLLNGKILK